MVDFRRTCCEPDGSAIFCSPYQAPLRADNLWITLPSDMSIDRLNQIIQEIRSADAPSDWNFSSRRPISLSLATCCQTTCCMI